jgi:glyoxylase-like metal-dependent hydrolase (beta-lactamase superfamily II)
MNRVSLRRFLVMAALLAVSAFSIATAGSRAPQQEPKVVRMLTLNVRDILYVLIDGGGNSLALMRDDGVVLIDTKLPGWGRPIVDAIGSVTDRPVTTIINTHAHPDHVGGNVEFPTVTQIIAHENTKRHMQKLDGFKGSTGRFLPDKTFTDKMSLFDGLDRLDLYYFGAGHTDGDLIAVFPEKGVALFGDLFPSKAAPFIDTANGGSGVAFPQTLARAVAEIKGVTRVITGHGDTTMTRQLTSGSVISANARTMTWNDVQEYADFNRDFLVAVREAIDGGKSVDDAAASLKLSDRYSSYDMQRAKANVQAIYDELKNRTPRAGR